jgi:pyruvate,water dikinase
VFSEQKGASWFFVVSRASPEGSVEHNRDLSHRRGTAVLDAIKAIITECRRLGLTCSICGQAPSVHPEYAARLVEWGIDSISVNVDAIDRTRHNIAVAEQHLLLERARSVG